MVFNLKKFHDMRVDNDLSQKKMSEILGISEDVYSNEENGRSNMSVGNAVAFANYFGVSLDYLLGISNDRGLKSDILYDSMVTSQRLKKVRLESKLSQEQISSLLSIPQRTYSSYEHGDRTIPLEFLFNFSINFNISIDYLTGRKKWHLLCHFFYFFFMFFFMKTVYYSFIKGV